MIGDGWAGEPSVRPGEYADDEPKRPARVAVVTGSRADFGLLRPVMRAIQRHPLLELICIAAGSHLVSPAITFRDVKAEFQVADSVPMQTAGRTGREADVESLARGVARFGRSFFSHQPDWVVVLGDRIEAFAAASAASVGGIPVAHIHGGDRAEGVADEAMRHAITKLSHMHLAATEESAERIRRMGERPGSVHVVGSPAIDGLADIPPLDDALFAELGSPDTVMLLHPIGRHPEDEEAAASELLAAVAGRRVLCLFPNVDPGRQGIVRAIEQSGLMSRQHLRRDRFIGLLKRIELLVGNSSAGLIEAAALGVGVVDIGDRQAGRERPSWIAHADREHEDAIRAAIQLALASRSDRPRAHPYGDGQSGERIAALLAKHAPRAHLLVRKHNSY